MAVVTIIFGGSSHAKQVLLDYCFKQFEEQEIWLVDSLQVFDPYWLSRRDVSRARRLLRSIRIARPFTIYQLRDKLFTFTKIPVSRKSSVIVSGLDCMESDLTDQREQAAVYRIMLELLVRLQTQTGCAMIIGVKKQETLDMITKNFDEVMLWEEPSSR